jgi:hypothetical protein
MSRTLAAAVLLTFVAGCSNRDEPKPLAGPEGGGATPSVPKTGAGGSIPYLATDRLLWSEYATRDDRLVFLMWVDLVGERGPNGGSSRGGGASPSGVYYHGSSRHATGLKIEWQCDSPDGLTGSMKINGANYDLAKGRVFLVTVKVGGTQVRQLERDLSKVRAEDTNAYSIADAEIAKFITVEKK